MTEHVIENLLGAALAGVVAAAFAVLWFRGRI